MINVELTSFSVFVTKNKLTFFRITLSERISRKSRRTAAYRIVIDYLTTSIEATGIGTRIQTFFPYTCFILGTFHTHKTFWTTRGWCANITSITSANAMTVHNFAKTVGAARRWFAWILNWFILFRYS